jgi:hypothetical protein
MQSFVDEESQKLAEELQRIATARKHRPSQPGTEAHRKFLQLNYEKVKAIQEKYPHLSLHEELEYFSTGEPVR